MTELSQKHSHDEVFDVVIVGAGVVGCAMARRYALEGAKVALLEKAADILDGASKANSAILHTGFDAPVGSIEHGCIQDGYDEYQHIHERLGLPIDRSSAFVVAWSDDEESKLQAILEQAHQNGVVDAKLVSKSELAKHEPELSSKALAAVEIPGESLIDPWTSPYAYLMQALACGATILRKCELLAGEFDGLHWCLNTSRGELKTKHVINCAGLYGDSIDEKLLGKSSFTIKPRKGQFVVFDKPASKLLNAIILPVPSERTKGIVLFRTVFGNLAVGPTAEEQESRTDASTSEAALQMLLAAGIEKVPALATVPVSATYAGLRPATEYKDYQVEFHKDQNWITVGGIRSTGLSAALGIAKYVYELHHGSAAALSELKQPNIAPLQVLVETEKRDWQQKGYGEIICHCERVTLREIEHALTGELNAQSMQGLKRKTRVTMGRCQGFFCSARLAEITANRFSESSADENHND